MNPVVKCPTCKTPVEWSKDSQFRPFCSKRCRLIDLGEWASESHVIPVSEFEQEFDIPDEQFNSEDSQF